MGSLAVTSIMCSYICRYQHSKYDHQCHTAELNMKHPASTNPNYFPRLHAIPITRIGFSKDRHS